LRDQPNEPILFLRQRTTRMLCSRRSHRNLAYCQVLRRSLESAVAVRGSIFGCR
jgi:hypothetical protein